MMGFVTHVREILNKHKHVLYGWKFGHICSFAVLFQGGMFSIKWECQLPERQILMIQKSQSSFLFSYRKILTL